MPLELTDAQRAAIQATDKIIEIRNSSEADVGVALDRIQTELLRSVFVLGFEAGRASVKDSE